MHGSFVSQRTTVRRALCLAVAAAAAGSLAACGSSASAGANSATSGGSGSQDGVTSTSIDIGTTTPLTGAAASTCTPVNDGSQAWFKSVNAQGGINGRKINDDVEDDQYTAPNALNNVRSFITKPVLAVFGGCGSIQPPAIAPVLKAAGVPYLFPLGASPDLNSDSDAYQDYPQYGQIFPSLVKHEMQVHGPGKLFVIAQTIPGSDQTLTGIQQATEAAGGTYVGADSPLSTQTDWNADALKIKQDHVGYLVLILLAGQATAVVNTLAAQNALPTTEILGNITEGSAAFLAAAGNTVKGKMVVAAATMAPSAPNAAACVAARKKYAPGTTVDTFSLWGCASAQAFTTAVQALGHNVTRSALTQELDSWHNKQVSPALPALTYTDAGDHSGISTFNVLVLNQSGELVQDTTLDLAK
jgi:branched-chain amino acid transport system substrate-binding protein